MFEFLNEVSVWLYLIVALIAALIGAMVVSNPKRAIRFILHQNRNAK